MISRYVTWFTFTKHPKIKCDEVHLLMSLNDIIIKQYWLLTYQVSVEWDAAWWYMAQLGQYDLTQWN